NTHEILEPRAYLEREKTPAVSIPDLSGLLSSNYDTYDSGTMGQLDVRILAEQLGTENDMFTIAPNWNGGAYVAVKRKSAAAGQEAAVATGDVSLLYVSRWKTTEAAQRFMGIYEKSLPKRVGVSDDKPWVPSACANRAACPSLQATRVNTNEGPVFLELLPDNTVFIAQSFSEETANSLRRVVLGHAGDPAPRSAGPELTVQLQQFAAFEVFQEQVGQEILKLLANSPRK